MIFRVIRVFLSFPVPVVSDRFPALPCNFSCNFFSAVYCLFSRLFGVLLRRESCNFFFVYPCISGV
ncbi:MAG: hypothetical protein IJF84_02370 [Thermoguttaceae bacterium]|nr:hypothetical protein [Thermoguttaceae bacterium]